MTATARSKSPARSETAIAARVARLDWPGIETALDSYGAANAGALLEPDECAALAALYVQQPGSSDPTFRSRVVMARHGFGRGEYQYFAYPLPPHVADLREGLYPHLAAIANRWAAMLGEEQRFPPGLSAYLARCRAAGQARPTPLMLCYGKGDYNCLHQDLYGEEHFPLQVTILLSRPERDFTGGELVLTE